VLLWQWLVPWLAAQIFDDFLPIKIITNRLNMAWPFWSLNWQSWDFWMSMCRSSVKSKLGLGCFAMEWFKWVKHDMAVLVIKLCQRNNFCWLGIVYMGGIAKASLLWERQSWDFWMSMCRSSVKLETGTGLFCQGILIS
jgi:hypothetical protein